LINRYEPNDVYLIQKFYEQLPLQVVYFDGKSKQYNVKRFLVETSTLEKKFLFISEEKGSKLIECSLAVPMLISLTTTNKKGESLSQEINISEFMDVKGWKAVGNRLTIDTVKKVTLVSEKYGKIEVIEDVTETDVDSDSEDDSNSNGGNSSSGGSNDSSDDNSNQSSKRIEPIVPPESNGPQLNLL
jgi:topoisomerase-4 subunit A